MRKSRFTEAQIVGIVREYDAGTPVAELARKHGIHANTIRLWKSKYNGMEVADVVRLKELEAENAQMHRIIAKLTLKVDAMDNLIRKNGWGLRSDKKR
jgi:putative transposase